MRIGIDLDGVCYDFADALRRWLERHALIIALLGLLMLLGSAVFWAILWLPSSGWVPAAWMERWPWN